MARSITPERCNVSQHLTIIIEKEEKYMTLVLSVIYTMQMSIMLMAVFQVGIKIKME